jgi:hypothetical protein
MKMKTLKQFVIAAVITLGIAFTASAQKAQTYTLAGLTGGTAVIPIASTNTFNPTSASTNTFNVPNGATFVTNTLSLTCSEFDKPAVTFAFTGTATSTNSIAVYRSYDDGRSYEAVPTFSATGIAPGAASFITNAVIDATGASSIALKVTGTGTTASTNALLEVRLKSPKYGAKAATQ